MPQVSFPNYVDRLTCPHLLPFPAQALLITLHPFRKAAMSESLRLREGNRALNYALSQPLSTKAQRVIELIPRLANELYACARDGAKGLFRKNGGLRQRLLNRIYRGAMETELANCIYDLQLTAVFSTLSQNIGDNEIASLIVDALLYQATGFEAAKVTNAGSLLFGSEGIRGIHKYQFSGEDFTHIGDPVAWTFGKEYAMIVHNAPLDSAHIMSMAPVALEIRVTAPWIVNLVLYGKQPTKEDREKLRQSLENVEKSFDKMAKSLPT